MPLTTLSYFKFESKLHSVAFNADPNTTAKANFALMFILPSSMSWSTVSKAAERSSNTSITHILSSIASKMSLWIPVRAVSVLCPIRQAVETSHVVRYWQDVDSRRRATTFSFAWFAFALSNGSKAVSLKHANTGIAQQRVTKWRNNLPLICQEWDPKYKISQPLRRDESSRVDKGDPMDLFLKMSVLQANVCWLGVRK